MSCNGCYGGCVDITSDQCVKYTGEAIVAFGIEAGMPMSEVTEKITEYLLEVLEGTGIEPTLPGIICDLVHNYLPEGDATLNDVIEALINAACDLQTQVDGLDTILDGIEANYTIGCLTGVTVASGTHNILQAAITKLCTVYNDTLAIWAEFSRYEKKVDLCNDVANCLAVLDSTKHYHKMIPYVAVEYYGPIDDFNINGVGQGDWEQVYLCNGENGTPNKKGRIPIGMTTMGGSFDAFTNPVNPANPAYTVLKQTEGANTITLAKEEMPVHDHLVDVPVVNDPGHRHVFASDPQIADATYTRYGVLTNGSSSSAGGAEYYTKSETGINNKISQTTGISVSVNVLNSGESHSHSNIPPVMACYYIIYIPNP
jgi:microcystin-dependent protein